MYDKPKKTGTRSASSIGERKTKSTSSRLSDSTPKKSATGNKFQRQMTSRRRPRASMSAWQCNYCNDAVEEEDDSIECFVCKNWCHAQCTDLTQETFDTLTDPLHSNIQWVCQPCMDDQKEIQSKQDARLDKLLDLIPLVHSLSARMEKMEKGLGEKLEERIEEVVDRKLEVMMEEKMEIEKRKKNVVIVNLKESTKTEIEEKRKDDLKAAKNLIGKLVALEEDELIEPIRLGREGGTRPRMLRVTVRGEEKKKEIMRKAPELNKDKAHGDTRIYINHDFTQKQREKNKTLRNEKQRRTEAGEQNLVIRNGKIVTAKPGPKPLNHSGGGAEATQGAGSSGH